jgi:dihydroorotase/N-acyl-D-amino-acid deacylase
VVITNGRIVDGTGAPWFRADVGLTGDRITAIGNLAGARAGTRIDARGLAVAPGFIDLLGQSEFNVLVDSRAASKITQGITTEITGEGVSIAPVDDEMMAERKASYEFFKIAQDWRTLDQYFARLARSTSAINVGTFVGSGGVRDYVVGKEDRAATADEMAQMKALVADAMADGALGLSSSLQYIPNRFSTTDELVELAKVAAEHGGIYITHQRSEGNKVFESVDEVLAIAERADIPTEIWHLKTAYRANWGKMTEVLRRIDAARARGVRVSANIYPYDRASNGLDACLPIWVREGGTDAMLQRLADPATRARVKRDMDDPNAPFENQWYGSGGPAGVMLSSVLDPALRKYEGLTFEAIGKAMGKDPRDAAIDLVIADKAESSVIIAIMRESDVVEAMRTPWVSFDTDSGARAEDGPLSTSKSHPRAWGTFPRVGHLPARARQVRARGPRAHAGGSRAQDDLAGRDSRRHHGPGPDPSGHDGRPRRLRPGHDRGRGHVRTAEPVLGRRAARVCQRPGGRRRRRDHVRASRAAPARSRIPHQTLKNTRRR